MIFGVAGNFCAQILADAESANETINGTYSVANGILALSTGGETIKFRISPDGETLANVDATQSEGPKIDNEALWIFIKESLVYPPGDDTGDRKLDLADVLLPLKILTGVEMTQVRIAGDVNADCQIGLAEAVYNLHSPADKRQQEMSIVCHRLFFWGFLYFIYKLQLL